MFLVCFKSCVHSEHSGTDIIITNIMANSRLLIISSLLMQTTAYHLLKNSVFSCIEGGVKFLVQVYNF